MPAVDVRDLCKVYLSHRKAPGLTGSIRGLFRRDTIRVDVVDSLNASVAAAIALYEVAKQREVSEP